MKERLISALVALIIFVPLIIVGDMYFKIGLSLVGLLAIKEIMDVKKNVISTIRILTYVLVLVLILINISIPIKIFIIFIIYFTLLLFFDSNKYNIEMCGYLCMFSILFVLVFTYLHKIRITDMNTLIYLLLISTCTDTFAFFGGNLFGKRKLIPRISPNKTIEGALIGALFGTIIPSIFYIYMVMPGADILSIILLTFILSILGQIGDLIFSSIKRYFKVKDFSHIMPGHGGVLDRLDSLIFITISYIVLINFI